MYIYTLYCVDAPVQHGGLATTQTLTMLSGSGISHEHVNAITELCASPSCYIHIVIAGQ